MRIYLREKSERGKINRRIFIKNKIKGKKQNKKKKTETILLPTYFSVFFLDLKTSLFLIINKKKKKKTSIKFRFDV